MIEVFEAVPCSKALATAERLGVKFTDADRVFLLREQGETGVAVLRLEGDTVVLDAARIDGGQFEYYDLLVRAVLAVVRDFNPIRVKINTQVIKPPLDMKYFERLGFNAESDGVLRVMSDKIDLSGTCCRKEK